MNQLPLADPLVFSAGPFLGISLFILNLIVFGGSIYAFVLFVKLAHRGIKVLDIYLDKNSQD